METLRSVPVHGEDAGTIMITDCAGLWPSTRPTHDCAGLQTEHKI